MNRWAIDDHIAHKGDGGGKWYLYDTYEHNDGPPCAVFDEEAKIKEVCAALNKLEDMAEVRAQVLEEALGQSQVNLLYLAIYLYERAREIREKGR